MIFGVGTDIIEVERVEAACRKSSFCDRIFTKKEQELIGTDAQKAAGNFAVKEAVVKAFGTGFSGIRPIEIEVLREVSGKPYVVLYGKAEEFRAKQQIQKVHVSISDTKVFATAYAVAETYPEC